MRIYANVVALKVTPTEFVLEFGSFFAERPNQGPPSDYKPDVQVVMQPAVIDGFLETLTRVKAQMVQQAATRVQTVKTGPGFIKPQP
jgi:hypothetical protein